jgi:hypothetical protein
LLFPRLISAGGDSIGGIAFWADMSLSPSNFFFLVNFVPFSKTGRDGCPISRDERMDAWTMIWDPRRRNDDIVREGRRRREKR